MLLHGSWIKKGGDGCLLIYELNMALLVSMF